MSVDETMSHSSISAFKEECYTETVFNAGLLKKALFDGRGTPEQQLQNFYSSFYQLWQMTRYSLSVKNRMTSRQTGDLDLSIEKWFKMKIQQDDRERACRAMSAEGIAYAEQWIKELNAAGII